MDIFLKSNIFTANILLTNSLILINCGRYFKPFCKVLMEEICKVQSLSVIAGDAANT
jgi:hypothetical protein